MSAWCRLLSHRWEQTPVGGVWRFRCRRCGHVEGYCSQAHTEQKGARR